MTNEELGQLLSQAEDMPYGPAKIALIEQLLRHVDTAGDPELAFAARLIGTTAYIYGGEPAKAFATFSWCVADFDKNPQPYHQRAAHSLLWLFKAMVNALTKFPEVPLPRTYAVLDDMERRYREFGRGMQAVYKYRYVVADHVGLRDDADGWYEKWQAAPRDTLSDCVGCDPTDVAAHLSARGRYAEAVEHADPVLSGRLNCTEQPQGILQELMVPYLMTGREQDAADAHRRSYRLQRGNLADMADIAGHITFCARTGNEHRGLEILQRHVDWLDRAPSPAAAMEFSAAGGLLLRRVSELGHGDTVVRRRDHPETTVAALAEELAAGATALAARFDARNGTTAQSTRIAEWLAHEPYPTRLSLSPLARPAGPAVPPPAAAPRPVEVPEAGPAELLDLAEEHAFEDRDDAVAATLAAFDRRFPEAAAGDPRLAGRRLALAGQADWSRDPEGVMASWERAIELLTEAGASAEAAAARGRLGLARCFTGRPADGLPLIEAEVAWAGEHGDDRRRASAWSRLGIARFVVDDFAGAREALDRSDAAAARPRQRAFNALWRARVDQALDRPGEALEAASAARDFFREHGSGTRLAEACLMVADLETDADRVVAAFSETLATGVPEAQLIARAGRGRALLDLDRADEAVHDLVEAAGLCAERDMAEAAAFIRQDLAKAYHRAGRPVEAAEVAEEALLRFEQLGMTPPADDVRFLLAGLYREIGDTEGALTLYRTLIEGLAGNPAGRGQVAEAAGGLLYDLDRDAEAALTFQAAAEALHEAGDLVGELRLLRRRVSALHYADDAPAALAAAEHAERLYAALPAATAAEPNAVWQRSMVAREAAGLLIARERYAEALPYLRGVPERLRRIGAEDDAARLEGMLGEALLGSGSPAEAEALLRALLERLPADAPVREYVTKIHAEALNAR